MSEPRRYLFVGGPLDGQWLATTASIIEMAEAPDMAYHRTRPTNTNWRTEYDPDWWIKNMPEPKPPDHVFEWHSREWVSPEVGMIRSAVRDAADKMGRA